MKRRLLGALLALTLCTCLPIPALAEEDTSTQSSEQAEGAPATLDRSKILWLAFLGPTALVTGMWISLYKRGKR